MQELLSRKKELYIVGLLLVVILKLLVFVDLKGDLVLQVLIVLENKDFNH